MDENTIDLKIRSHRTLCYLLNDLGIYLSRIRKDEGHLLGIYNGYGGKREHSDKSIEDTALRETNEESGFTIRKEDLDLRAVITFYFPFKPDWNQIVNVYFVRNWSGKGHETKEMGEPEFFPYDKIPYDKMWDSDKIWLKKIINERKLIEGVFYWKEDNKTVESYTIKEVKDF